MNEAIVVFAITIFAFVFARQHLTNVGFARNDYVARCAAWLLINCAAFTLGSYWLYAAISSLALAFYARKDSNPLALFCFLLFAVPNIAQVLPGPGPIDTIIVLTHHRLLSLLVLLPVAWREFSARSEARPYMRLPDILIALFLIWTVGSSGIHSESVTISIRMAVEAILDVVLPYYVASRYMTKVDQFYDVAAVIVAALFVSALIAIFESSRTWLLYEALKYKWEDLFFNLFQMRGVLRAPAASASPITLGFNMVVGLGFVYLLRWKTRQKLQNSVIMLALLGGLLATVSRGPWVGAVALIVAIAGLGPGKFKRLTLLLLTGGGVITILLLSPYGDAFVSYLPWVGTIEANTITFRENLFRDSLTVISENPLFGDRNFALHPLMVAQSYEGGFQDIANTYLGYALVYGLFGLTLFVLIICSSLLRLRAIVKIGPKNSNHLVGPARVMFGITVAMAVVFGTASMGGEMGVMLWITVGLTSALLRMSQQKPKKLANARLGRDQVI